MLSAVNFQIRNSIVSNLLSRRGQVEGLKNNGTLNGTIMNCLAGRLQAMAAQLAVEPWRGVGCWITWHYPPEVAVNDGPPCTDGRPKRTRHTEVSHLFLILRAYYHKHLTLRNIFLPFAFTCNQPQHSVYDFRQSIGDQNSNFQPIIAN